jgi:hypothetical protein
LAWFFLFQAKIKGFGDNARTLPTKTFNLFALSSGFDFIRFYRNVKQIKLNLTSVSFQWRGNRF